MKRPLSDLSLRGAAFASCAEEDGAHLFGLLDLVRLFPLAAGGEAAFGVLLEEARAWYRAAGKRRFLHFMEDGDLSHAERAGMGDLGAADLLVLGSELIPEQLIHTWEVTAPRDEPPLRRRSPAQDLKAS